MKIKKRDGSFEKLSFDRITYRLKKMAKDPHLGKLNKIDTDKISQKVVSSLYDEISSSEIDEESARICINTLDNEEYAKLASRIIISNLHKNTIECFSETMEKLYERVINEIISPIVSEKFINFIRKNKNELNEYIDYSRDYNFNYFGYKTLEKSYLFKIQNKVVERPQHMYMRVAVALHINETNLDNVFKTYNLISEGYYTHASPTLFNAAKYYQNFSSCFLIGSEDSMEGIYKTLSDCAVISKMGGGIGIHIHDIRGKGSIIRKTNGISDGIIPMLKVFNATSEYSNQSGARKGSFAIYLEPWHTDILAFVDLKKNSGLENMRARDLFYALWIPDLFMEKVEKDLDWYLMCPDESVGLMNVYGEEFNQLYEKYVSEGKYRKKIKAQELWFKIVDSQIETGTPYLLYKDAVNKKSNQKNIGVIKSSNLCAEITLVSNNKEYGTCNLASLSLPKYIEKNEKGSLFFNYQKLFEVCKYIIEPMNCVIDNNYYPTKETKLSNLKHRPLGIGVQGLHDVFLILKTPFGSEKSKRINKDIFETIYYGLLSGSNEEAKLKGAYETFEGSPASKGILQFDMWEIDPKKVENDNASSVNWDWNSLKESIKKFGLRNSMLSCCMPTASTAQILGNFESIEPFDTCIYKKTVLSGEYLLPNKYLINDLTKLKLWDNNMKDTIIANGGSIQNIPEIPDKVKELYKTVWEMSMKDLIDMSTDRAPFIDHTQSLNLFVKDPNIKKITSMHFYAWKKGLKTGIYYLRTNTDIDAGKFSIDPELEKQLRENKEQLEKLTCSINNKEDCLMCSS